MDQTIYPPLIDANLGPDAFRLHATRFYAAFKGFDVPERFSPVPFFLLARAMELTMKAHFLEGRVFSQDDVRGKFHHRLYDAYRHLPPDKKVLSPDDEKLLKRISDLYAEKAFEYFVPKDALTGYRRYPALEEVDALARRLLEM